MKRMNSVNRLSKYTFLFLCLILTATLIAGCAANNNTQASEHTTSEKVTGASEPVSTAGPSTDTGKDTGSHILVAYFSATGHTAPIAEYTADILGADLYEIKAKQLYTEADLAYYTDGRCDREQADPSVRPEIDGEVGNMEQYDTVLIGHPIWHGQAPRIISTFLESYDFSNKTLVTFCTSASSGLGSSASNLYGLVPSSAIWLESRRFAIGTAKDDVAAWLKEIGIGTTTKTKEMETLTMKIDNTTVAVDWEDNESVEALKDIVKDKPLTIQMYMYGGFEQVGSLGTSLPRNDVQTTTSAGDIVLYSGNQIVVFYGSNSWAYTRLGHITDKTAAEMAELLGNGNVTITISME